MNVLLLGNGFDLNYKLPTKYINFLNTVNFLSTLPSSDGHCVGEIFGAPLLQNVDKDISNSYRVYQKIYDRIPLASEAVEKLTALASDNLLYGFLHESYNKDIGWIDFEKEISAIIRAFAEFLQIESPEFDAECQPMRAVDRVIILFFNSWKKSSTLKFLDLDRGTVSDGYVVEYPYGSGNKVIDKEKIIHELEKQLQELSDGLQIYLKCFVEKVVAELCQNGLLQQFPALMPADKVITFNYTNTYEQVYHNREVFHIHGDLDKKIVLGVNPDEADEFDTIDISFLKFKKYYQRVLYHTDVDFLKWIFEEEGEMQLVVMGHSLDVTDKDIIMQVFGRARNITILYFNENSEASLIANLIKIYGKTGFDNLRVEKHLRFFPQTAKYDYFAEDRRDKEIEKERRAASLVIY